MSLPTCFLSQLPEVDDRDLVICMDAQVVDRDALFDEYSRKLNFPDYFGRNWDAFKDCINDFSWIEQRRVILCYSSLPKLPPADLGIFVSQMEDAILRSRSDPRPELILVVEQAS